MSNVTQLADWIPDTLYLMNLNNIPSNFFHERHLFGYYSLWLVVYKARMDIVLPACCTFQSAFSGYSNPWKIKTFIRIRWASWQQKSVPGQRTFEHHTFIAECNYNCSVVLTAGRDVFADTTLDSWIRGGGGGGCNGIRPLLCWSLSLESMTAAVAG